jgi:glutamine synthetase
VNSYKRLVVGRSLTGATWAPAYISYGDNNRSSMVRIPGGRLELRLPDGACNPYLATAAVIAAGMDGIERKLDPGAPHNVNLYELSDAELKKESAMLPQNLHEALTALEKDKVIRDALGPVADEFLRLKHMEWVEYMRHVSEWEIESTWNFSERTWPCVELSDWTAGEEAGAAAAARRADGADADRHDRARP